MPEALLPIAEQPTPFYGEEHAELRRVVRRFVESEIRPFADAWDEAEGFPRDLYRKAGEAGLLGVGFPESYGGAGGDWFHRVVLSDELARGLTGGVSASLMSHHIGLPPILTLGSEELKTAHRTRSVSRRKGERARHHGALGRFRRRAPANHGAA